MGIEVRPLNVLCNIQCQYCYQHPQRDSGHIEKQYDLVKIKSAIEAEGGGPFTLFGGEPLLVPIEDLEDLWAWGYARKNNNSVQTNGILINDAHISLFHKYKVGVGISIDGPGELNDARWHGTLQKTRESTAKCLAAIQRLCDEGLHPSLIITLHRTNATCERLPRLIEWVRTLYSQGIRRIRLHTLEVDNVSLRESHALSIEENVEVLTAFLKLQRELTDVDFCLFSEMRQLLLGEDGKTCIWNGCDPYTTPAVRGIEGQGQRSNCGRTNKDGVDFVKSSSPGFERYLTLYETPQSDGGCQDCRFFLMCKGQCPGTAIDNDWRNRTEHCDVWKAIFEVLEAELVAEGLEPLSLSGWRPTVEEAMIARWAEGRYAPMKELAFEYREAMKSSLATSRKIASKTSTFAGAL
jgi:uncharacterized protein